MATYRCFFKGHDGRIEAVEHIDAEGDDIAKRHCMELLKLKERYHAVELWELDRLAYRHP